MGDNLFKVVMIQNDLNVDEKLLISDFLNDHLKLSSSFSCHHEVIDTNNTDLFSMSEEGPFKNIF